jgi:hypothetical protein
MCRLINFLKLVQRLAACTASQPRQKEREKEETKEYGGSSLTGFLPIGLVCSRRCPVVPLAAFVADLGHFPDLLEDLHTEALVVGVVAGEMAVALALGVGAGAAEDELFPVAHCGVICLPGSDLLGVDSASTGQPIKLRGCVTDGPAAGEGSLLGPYDQALPLCLAVEFNARMMCLSNSR